MTAQVRGVTVVPVVVTLCESSPDRALRAHKWSKRDALKKVLQFIIGNLGHVDPVNTRALNSRAFCSSFRKSNMNAGLLSKASDQSQSVHVEA